MLSSSGHIGGGSEGGWDERLWMLMMILVILIRLIRELHALRDASCIRRHVLLFPRSPLVLKLPFTGFSSFVLVNCLLGKLLTSVDAPSNLVIVVSSFCATDVGMPHPHAMFIE